MPAHPYSQVYFGQDHAKLAEAKQQVEVQLEEERKALAGATRAADTAARENS